MTYQKEEIQERMIASQTWLERGILAIYKKQTLDEQRIGDVKYHNKVGFSGAHARSGSYYATWILSGKHLSGIHLEKARGMMQHYAGQLVKIANKEI